MESVPCGDVPIKASLASLPTELRVNILRNLLRDANVSLNLSQCAEASCTRGSRVPNRLSSSTPMVFPILATCRLLRESAIPILVQDCEFRIKLPSCDHNIVLPFGETYFPSSSRAKYWFSLRKLCLVCKSSTINFPWHQFTNLGLIRLEFHNLIHVSKIVASKQHIKKWLACVNLAPLLRLEAPYYDAASASFLALQLVNGIYRWKRSNTTKLQIREMVKVRNTDQTRSGVSIVDLVRLQSSNKSYFCMR